jgi:hypothetical protein
MKMAMIISVQLINGTEKHGLNGSIYNRFKKTTPATCRKIILMRRSYNARLSHQTVFSMWKTWMQMYKRSRSWSQILSIDKLPWPQAGTTLCSPKLPEFNRTTPGQLSGFKRCYRRNKQYQSGNITQERRVINITNGYYFRPFRC